MNPPRLKHINVVAGLIFRKNRLLVCQRGSSGAFPLKWEFPGGKVESGENFEAALRRELKEELGIDVGKLTQVFTCRHSYPGICEVGLRFFKVHSFKGTIENRVFQAIDWVAVSELPGLDFLEADLALIRKLAGPGKAVFDL